MEVCGFQLVFFPKNCIDTFFICIIFSVRALKETFGPRVHDPGLLSTEPESKCSKHHFYSLDQSVKA